MDRTEIRRFEVLVFCWICIAALSLVSLAFYLYNELYYADGNLISQNLLEDGKSADTTTVPPEEAKLCKNGIVIFYALGEKLGARGSSILIILTLLSFVMQWLAVYPLWKIAERCGLDSLPGKLTLVVVYLLAWHMNLFQYAPLNDGIFRTGSLWLLYWMAESNIDLEDRRIFSLRGWIFFIAAAATKALLIYFNIYALIIPLAGVAAAILSRRFRSVLPWAVVLLIMAFSFFFICNKADIPFKFDLNLKSISQFFQHTLPEALFIPLGAAGNLLYAGFAAAILIALWQGISKRNFAVLLIAMVCLSAIILLMMQQEVHYRQLLMIFPLMYLLILRRPATRPIGILFVFAVLVYSIMLLSATKDHGEEVRILQNESKPVQSPELFQ